jgi:hypothetical protein
MAFYELSDDSVVGQLVRSKYSTSNGIILLHRYMSPIAGDVGRA